MKWWRKLKMDKKLGIQLRLVERYRRNRSILIFHTGLPSTIIIGEDTFLRKIRFYGSD